MGMNNELVPVDEITSVLQAAPSALQINQEKTAKAVQFGKDLLDRIAQYGMSDELDEECNRYLVKLKNTYADMNDRRKPLTEMLDKIKKTFTTLESQIDPKTREGIYAQVQDKRNQHAAAKAQEKKRLEEEAAKKHAREKELIQLRSEAELSVRNSFLKQLELAKRNLHDAFNNITLNNWESGVSILNSIPRVYMLEYFELIEATLRPTSILITSDDIKRINSEVKAGDVFARWSKEYETEIQKTYTELSLKLHSRHNELTEIARKRAEAEAAAKRAKEEQDSAKRAEAEAAAKRAKEEQEQAEKEALERKAMEEQRLIAAATAAEEAAKKEMEAKKAMNVTNALFEAEVAAASAPESNAIESWSIHVQTSSAWLLVVMFYFEREGKGKHPDELEKKTLAQMRSYCEKQYKKTGERIESPYIIYEPNYTVRATK